MHCQPAEVLRDLQRPMNLRVGLERRVDEDLAYQTDFGWTPELGHSVVPFGFRSNHQVEIADPTPDIGRERWFDPRSQHPLAR